MTICCISFHPCRCIRKHSWPCHKNGHGQPSVIIWTNYSYLSTRSCIPSFKVICLLIPKKMICEGFYHIRCLDATFILVMWPGTFEHIFIQTSDGGSVWNLASNGLVFLWGKEVWKRWIWKILDKCQWITLTLACHKSSCIHLFDYMYMYTYIHLTGFNSFLETYSLSIFPYKNKRDQMWPCCKIGHGQPRVIIWIL